MNGRLGNYTAMAVRTFRHFRGGGGRLRPFQELGRQLTGCRPAMMTGPSPLLFFQPKTAFRNRISLMISAKGLAVFWSSRII